MAQPPIMNQPKMNAFYPNGVFTCEHEVLLDNQRLIVQDQFGFKEMFFLLCSTTTTGFNKCSIWLGLSHHD